MPRQRKPTMSGAPGQKVSAVAGQMYGSGVEQERLQAAMPAPDARSAQPGSPSPSASPSPAPAAPSGPAQPVMQQAPDFASLLEKAKAMQGRAGLLRNPTQRPEEPITAGLSTGPGPGPMAMQARTGTPTGDTMRRLSALTGDPYLAELARRANA